jgi:DNA-binding transcriptional MerR regulator
MLIGELASRTSVSARAIRHYEKLSMLHSERGENGYRHYGEESVEWVKSIQFLLSSGLKLAIVAQILPTLMGSKCLLGDEPVRAAMEREAENIHDRMEQLAKSHKILCKALKKGYIRRPGS